MREGLKFRHPLYCDLQELDSVLDCYSSSPKGHWPVRPKLVAPLSHYQACREFLERLLSAGPDTVPTAVDYLLSILRTVDCEASLHLEHVLSREE